MLYPTLPSRFLWRPIAWGTRVGMGGHDFAIWASPDFLKAAKTARYDEGRLQKLAREIFKESGKSVEGYETPFEFGEYGLNRINLFRNGMWFVLEGETPDRYMLRGGVYSCHNIDHAQDQSILMALWLRWVDVVETSIEDSEKRQGKKNKS